jgi:hypothetical protein
VDDLLRVEPDSPSPTLRSHSKPRWAGALGVHRRDLGRDHHGQAPSLGLVRQAAGGRRTAWSVEDHHVCSRPAARRNRRSPCVRRRDQRVRLRTWVAQALATPLCPGDLVLSDNLAAYRSRASATRSKHGLPGRSIPHRTHRISTRSSICSPSKALLRTAATRTANALWHGISQALDAFSLAECAHCLGHAGYGPSNRNPLRALLHRHQHRPGVLAIDRTCRTTGGRLTEL